ncbi:MAG: aminopeptidase P family protein [Flavobacteriales bacterium]|nr:aminopeptidase P family protein [Flavobacteriales bacterium]
MKYHKISPDLFCKNRKKFTSQMENGCLAVFNSNDIYPISADGTMPFQQHRDIFYLSGVDQEESILVLFPQASNPAHREVLFLRETNEHIAIWEGEKLTKQTAFDTSGIKTVYWLQQFQSIFKQLMAEAQIRSVKEKLEIDLMQQACNITESGFRRLLSFIKPGVWEYEIEAELANEFLRNRSKGFAYTPIVASGKNACVLHYIENNQQCKDGDVILLDVGAEYANYSSDLTRCVPVNGRFTSRQKEVYNAVLHVKNEAQKLLVSGTIMAEYHKQVGVLMEEQLVNLGLISLNDIKNQSPDWPAYKKYFMHGTSHFLGLDTHDVGLWHEPIQAGMVFTCEPGIYIPEEGLGIRLEDDLVVQETGAPFNLMANIPIEAEAIEDLMNA